MQEQEIALIHALRVFMTTALVGTTAVLVYALLITDGRLTTLVISGVVGVFTSLLVLWLLHLRQFTPAKILLPLITFLLATYLIFSGQTVSVRDDAVLLYSLVVALAGLLLRRRGVLFFGGLSVATVEFSIYSVMMGWIGDPLTRNSVNNGTMLTVGVIYLLTFSMMYVLVDILTRNFDRVLSSQAQLSAANQELLVVRQSLEQQVRERTLAADMERVEAEMARAQAEAQVWFARGQAQLAEQMRGELDLPTLAANVTGFLSKYIGAQSGAMFVLDGEVYKLMGRYAYVDQPGLKREFAKGEGLIGEAAKTRLMIFVPEIPPDAPLIASALGQARPRKILVVPLELNQEVLGVLEFATLSDFRPEHEILLKRTTESIAIGLRTVQTRQQMSGLLEQSQQQTKALQERFEN